MYLCISASHISISDTLELMQRKTRNSGPIASASWHPGVNNTVKIYLPGQQLRDDRTQADENNIQSGLYPLDFIQFYNIWPKGGASLTSTS